ncbi:hypothetical protein [Vibrio chagasii]|uniref:hypothetical protein n=1 Tax=Vibrio chagasii TaxID=170679 RepID=UPI003DA0A0A7
MLQLPENDQLKEQLIEILGSVSAREVIDTVMMIIVETESKNPSGFVSKRDPKDHVSLSNLTDRMKKLGFIDHNKTNEVRRALACHGINLNNTRRHREQSKGQFGAVVDRKTQLEQLIKSTEADMEKFSYSEKRVAQGKAKIESCRRQLKELEEGTL